MSSKYTDREYSNMVQCYKDSGEITVQARKMYIEKGFVEEHRVPGCSTIFGVVVRVRETGSFRQQPSADRGRPSCYSEGAETAVINFFTANPSESCRVAARVLKLSENYVDRILQAEKLAAPYQSKLKRLLKPDLQARVTFCKWLLKDRSRNIMWTDEMTFTSEDCFNMYADNANMSNCAVKGMPLISRHVWAGLLNSRVLGPVFLEGLGGGRYQEFLAGALDDLLDDAPLADRRALHYQLDGAPAHCSGPVRQLLDARCGGRWIGCDGPVAWPPHSPDLSPLTSFFLGRVKSLVYYKKPEAESAEELEQRILAAFDRLRRDRATLRRLRDHTYAAARRCVARGGGDVEPFKHRQ